MIRSGDHFLHNMLGLQAYRQVAPDGVGSIEKAFEMFVCFTAKEHGPTKKSIPRDIAKSRNIQTSCLNHGKYHPKADL